MAASMEDLIGAMSGKVHVSQDGYDLNALHVSDSHVSLSMSCSHTDKVGIPCCDDCIAQPSRIVTTNIFPTTTTIPISFVYAETYTDQ
jgi:hypothetical protein